MLVSARVSAEATPGAREDALQAPDHAEDGRLHSVAGVEDCITNCHLCHSRTIPFGPGQRISAKRMHKAVLGGFNPYRDILRMPRTGSMFGESAEDLYREWGARALSDWTNWILCAHCAERFLSWELARPRSW